MLCKNCGKPFERTGQRHYFCDDCRELKRLEYNRKYDCKRSHTEKRKAWFRKYRSTGLPKFKKAIQDLTYKKFGILKQKAICSICGTRNRLEFHHVAYTPDDFIIVCKKCHINIHKTGGNLNGNR